MQNTKEYFNSMSFDWDKRQNISEERLYSIVEDLNLKRNDKVLDLGCGTGIITPIIYSFTNTRVIGIDISDKMIEIADRKNNNPEIEFLNRDYYEFNHDSFDVIVCYNAYPHFTDTESFKRKTHSLLNKNGRLIIVHSLSRKMLDSHHDAIAKEVSRHLKEVMAEADFYRDSFEIIRAIEDDNSYLIEIKRR